MSQGLERQAELRRSEADSGEPILKETVVVNGQGRNNNTPYVTPTSAGATVAGIEIGQSVTVRVYRDGVFISPND